MHYNRLVALVMTVNLGWAGYGATAANWWTSDGADLGAIALVAQTNLAAAVIFRQQYVLNALAWLVTRPPTSWPLRVRWTLGKYYHFGGLHVGAALAGTLWYLTLVVSMVRDAGQRGGAVPGSPTRRRPHPAGMRFQPSDANIGMHASAADSRSADNSAAPMGPL
jgi:hypothetical protein